MIQLNFFDKVSLFFHRLIKRRSENLCNKCPEGIKGTCCYYSMYLKEPDITMCKECPSHIAKYCKFPKDKIGTVEKKYIVILSRHPCKYLDIEAKMCTVFKNRFEKNKVCSNIKNAIKYGILHKECLYVSHNKKYRKGMTKVFYSEIKDKLCELGKIEYQLRNQSMHEVVAQYR